jgi:hypothetical protein
MAETSSFARYGNRKHEKGKYKNNSVVDTCFIMCEQNVLCQVTNGLQKSPVALRITGLLKDVKSVAYFRPFNVIPQLVPYVSSLGVNDML